METLEQTQIAVIAEKIDNGLVAFEERKERLTLLQQKAHGLKIESIDDRLSINTVSTMRKELKAARVEIEKEGKAMREPLTKLSKFIIEKESELVAIIEPTEKELQAQEKWVEGEKEKIRLAEEEKEKQRIQARIDKLAAFGFSIDYSTILTIDEPTFEKVLANAEVEYKKEQEIKAEKERQDLLEKQKLEDERRELEELRKKQAEAQKIIDAENARIRKEQEDKEAKFLADQKRLDDEAAAVELKNKQLEADRVRAIELENARKESAEKARLQAIEDARIEAEKKEAQKIADQKEAYRQAALRPDKDKLQAFANEIGELKLPEMSNENAQQIVNDVQLLLNKIQAHILRKIKDL